MRKALAIVIATVVSFVGPASAQMGVDEGDVYETDPVGEYYGDAFGEDAAASGGRAGSLEEARATGQGMRIGGGSLSPRTVPDVYLVRRGDTLWDITGRFYGDPWQWPRVWSFNPEITNPHWIYPDDPIRLVPEGARQVRLATPSARSPRTVQTRPGSIPGSVLLREEGYLDDDALRASGEVVGSPEDHMMLTAYDDVYVRLDNDEGVERGSELTIFRRMDDDERGPDEDGELVRIFGTVRVRSYDPETHIARAQITEALDPIERGFEVADVERRFEMVPPSENQVDIDSQVVAALRPNQLFGNYQIVFVGAGEEQGVRRGNRFFILRASDEWRESLTTTERTAGARRTANEPSEYPDEIVAEGRVVTLRPETAGLIITRSVREVEIGDRAEMRRGY
jgi:hypothetical protein